MQTEPTRKINSLPLNRILVLEMKANDTTIREFLEGTKQFIVPLFQRTYSWSNRNLEKMWTDLVSVSEDDEPSHFFGSFVTMPIASSPSTVSKFTIIDGQQRLTTIGVILASIRRKILDLDDECNIADEIFEQYLVNKFKPHARYKVVPTTSDRAVYYSIIDQLETDHPSFHPLVQAFETIDRKLSDFDDLDGLVQLKNALLSRFSVVDIILEAGDDPYLIFESLNATGTPLTQADLIRNYLFMGIGEDKQQKVYDTLWLPLQNDLGTDLEAFFRHYLAIGGQIPNIKRIYSTFRNSLGPFADSSIQEERTIQEMQQLKKYGSYYRRMLHPSDEENSRIKAGTIKLNRLRLTTSYPLLLNLHECYNQDRITEDEFAECLHAVEAFIVRRAVCGIPTNILNRYFPTVFQALDIDDLPGSLQSKFTSETGSRRVPSDEEFKKCLIERSLYGNRILRYLLVEIEKHENKEPPLLKDLQIEHIMPQTLSDEWKEELGSDWELIHQKYLDTLGNLTRTGYNQEYSNETFQKKRDMERGFRDSGLHINRELAKLDKWGKEEIEKRAQDLATKALDIWSL